MSCNDCKCNRVIRATSYTVGNSFNINTNFTISDLDNGMRFILTLPIDLPVTSTFSTLSNTDNSILSPTL